MFIHSIHIFPRTALTIITREGLKRSYCIVRPKVRDVILFPGQGTQFVGMGANLVKNPAVQEMYETANNILGYNLLEMSLNGPKSELDRTMYCQPAVFVNSLAALEKYKQIKGKGWFEKEIVVTAGYSVGELAALVLSKALTFQEGLKLVDIRAKAMQKASDENPSGMVTVTGLREDEIEELLKSVRELCENAQILIANYLYSKGFVVAGERTAIDCLLKMPHGGKMNEVSVSGAFHTPLMKSALPVLSRALKSINVKTPEIQVYSNVTGEPYKSTEEIKKLLPRQVVEPVLWQKTMKEICQSNYEQTFYEVGPGRQLAAVLAKIDRRLVRKCRNIEV